MLRIFFTVPTRSTLNFFQTFIFYRVFFQPFMITVSSFLKNLFADKIFLIILQSETIKSKYGHRVLPH